MSTTAIVIGVVWAIGFVVSMTFVLRRRKQRREAGEQVPKGNPLIVVGAIAFVLLCVGVVIGPGMLAEQRHEELLNTGTPATAEITGIEETGNVYNRRPEVQVTVRVEPEGAEPFESQETWIFSVTDIQRYEVGTRVDVRYDPADHESVAIIGPSKPKTPAD